MNEGVNEEANATLEPRTAPSYLCPCQTWPSPPFPCQHRTTSDPPSNSSWVDLLPKIFGTRCSADSSDKANLFVIWVSLSTFSLPLLLYPPRVPVKQDPSLLCTDMLAVLRASAPSPSPGRAPHLHEGPAKWYLPGTPALAQARGPLHAPSSSHTCGHLSQPSTHPAMGYSK